MPDIKRALLNYLKVTEIELDRRKFESTKKLAEAYKVYNNDEEFYIKETEEYIYNLFGWNESGNMCQPFFDSCMTQCKKRKIKSFMDFGGGIGTLSILAKLNGIEKVYYVDYSDGLGKCAKYLFEVFNIDVIMIDSRDFKDFKENVDVIAMFDVIEHIKNPVELMNQIILNLDPKFIYATVCWDCSGGDHPMHYEYKMIFPTFMAAFGFAETIPSEFVRVIKWTATKGSV